MRGFALLTLALLSAAAAKENDVGFGLMFDAGSTGSRVHVYRWVYQAGKDLPEMTDDFFLETKPGLSAYKDEPSKAGPSLKPLMDFAFEKVPESLRSSVAARLFATAGLRLLPQDTQNALLESVRDYLASSPFIFKRDWVDIISGTTEAIGAWVTVNYLSDRIEGDKQTIGIVDLGGGSVQFACEDKTAPDAVRKEVQVGSKAFSVYVVSHLGYGLTQGRKGMTGLMGSEEDVCNLKGGKGDFAKCRALADKWIEEGGTEIPFVKREQAQWKGDWLAFSYFYDVLPPFGLGLGDTRPRLDQIEAKAGEVCSLDTAARAAAYADKVESDAFLTHSCMDLAYVTALMHHGMKVAKDDSRMFLGKKINGKELSWALGIQLSHLDDFLLPSDSADDAAPPSPAGPTALATIITSVGTTALGLGLVFAAVGIAVLRQRGKGLQKRAH